MPSKDTVRSAISDIMKGNTSTMKDKINTALFAKVSDALKTKKMEVSNDWLSSIPAPDQEEE